MNRIILFLFIIGISSYVQAQNTGFFVVISEKENCPRKFSTIDLRQFYCSSQKPIIDQQAFASVGEVILAKKSRYLDLFLSAKGMEVLKKLVATLPNATFILVVENKVIGVLENKDILGRFIRIDAEINSKEIYWIHDQLKSVL